MRRTAMSTWVVLAALLAGIAVLLAWAIGVPMLVF